MGVSLLMPYGMPSLTDSTDIHRMSAKCQVWYCVRAPTADAAETLPVPFQSIHHPHESNLQVELRMINRS